MKLNENLIEGFIEAEIKAKQAGSKANEEFTSAIKTNGINVSSLCDKTKFNRKSFYNKMTKKSFSGEEIKKFAKVINQ